MNRHKDIKLTCMHSKKRYGSAEVEMVYSPAMAAFVCPVCHSWSYLFSDLYLYRMAVEEKEAPCRA